MTQRTIKYNKENTGEAGFQTYLEAAFPHDGKYTRSAIITTLPAKSSNSLNYKYIGCVYLMLGPVGPYILCFVNS